MRNRNSSELTRCLCFRIGSDAFVRRKSSRCRLIDESHEGVHIQSFNSCHQKPSMKFPRMREKNIMEKASHKLWQLGTNFSILLGLPFNQNDSIFLVSGVHLKSICLFMCVRCGSRGRWLFFTWKQQFHSQLALILMKWKSGVSGAPRSLCTFFKTHFQRTKSKLFFSSKILQKTELSRNVATEAGNSSFSSFLKKNSNRHFFTRQKRMRHSFSSCSTIQRDNELHDIEFIDTFKWNETYFGTAKSLVERCARAQLSHSHSIALKHAKYCNEKRRMPYKSVP